MYTELPTPLQLDVADLYPEEILDQRLVKKGNVASLQVLIKWSTMPPSMATWEDHQVLRERFPDAAAWGQAATLAGGSVTPGVSPGVSLGKAYPGETSTTSTPSVDEDAERG